MPIDVLDKADHLDQFIAAVATLAAAGRTAGERTPRGNAGPIMATYDSHAPPAVDGPAAVDVD